MSHNNIVLSLGDTFTVQPASKEKFIHVVFDKAPHLVNSKSESRGGTSSWIIFTLVLYWKKSHKDIDNAKNSLLLTEVTRVDVGSSNTRKTAKCKHNITQCDVQLNPH